MKYQFVLETKQKFENIGNTDIKFWHLLKHFTKLGIHHASQVAISVCPKHPKGQLRFFVVFLQGKFTTKTDVWSFGVTLWEILTFAREQPYESQSDAKILSNLSNMWREGRPSVFLPTPHGCPREVRDLMYECWQREEKERPSFSEIHLFLQRKNLGFDPQHCQ